MTAGPLAAERQRPVAASMAGTLRRASRRVARIVAEHPDLVLVTGLLIVAALLRGVFLLRAPLFLRHDSVAYFQTGYELARGQGFDLPLRRTPLYPLFIGAVVWLFGEDLRGLAVAQHLLGLVSVVATYFLGKALFGRAAGAVAALLVALSAPLLIYERYILAEPLFIPLLLLGLLAVVHGLRADRGRWLVAGGALLAIAALARPIGQALLPIAAFAALASPRLSPKSRVPSPKRSSPRLGTWDSGLGTLNWRAAALVLLGFVVVLVPWIVRSALTSGRVGSAGALGQTLVGRIIRHDEGFVLPSPDSPSRHTDPQKVAVRRLILTQMARDARPSAINHRVRNQFGLTEAEANSAMQEVALEIFASQTGRYVEGTLAKFRRLLVGEDERLRVHWTTRKDGELRDDWLAEPSIAHLYSPPSAVEEREYPVAEAVTRVFQPYHWRWLLAPLVLIGLAYGLVRGPRGPTVLLLLTVLALVFPSAALVGYVPRYRYPADPLLAIVAAGGLVALIAPARPLAKRLIAVASGGGRISTPSVGKTPLSTRGGRV